MLFINGLSAQNNLNLTDVDKITYKHYNEQEWDELIQIGNEAIKNGIDFYYLNYRMGIAYYSKKRYRKAIPFFEKVIESTPEDAIAKEYLYYSYLLGSRLGDASKILYTFDEKYRKSIEFHKTKNLFNSLGLEYKYYSFGDFAVNETVNTEVVQKVRNSMNYFSVDLLNYSQNSSTFSFNASFINGNNSVYNIAYSPEVIQEKLKQYQFYVSWKEQIANGLILNFGLTYMRENLQWYDSQYSNGNSTTLIYDGSTNNFVGLMSLTKSIKNFDLSMGSSISRINDEKQAQPFISAKWFPFANTSVYTNTTVSYQYNFNTDNDNFIFKQSLVANLNSRFSLKVFGLYGKVYNFVDNNGMSIYNNLDAIDYWYGLSMNYYFNTTTQMYLSYRNDGQTNNYTHNNLDSEISYNVNSILVGLKFNF